MAQYRIMEHNKPMPDWQQDDFVASSPRADGRGYGLAVGVLRIELTEEEVERTLQTWGKK